MRSIVASRGAIGRYSRYFFGYFWMNPNLESNEQVVYIDTLLDKILIFNQNIYIVDSIGKPNI